MTPGIEQLESRLLFASVSARWTYSQTSGERYTTGQSITLTYSIVPDGTMVPSGDGEPAGGSTLRAGLGKLYGTETKWLQVIGHAFAEWEAISGIGFVYEPHDDGATVNVL